MGLQVDFSGFDAVDFLDLAIEVEKEARQHYERLESWIGPAEGAAPVGEFFRAMQGRELKHQQQLEEQRRRLFGDQPAHLSGVAVWDVEAPFYDDVNVVPSLRQALEMALDMESRAYQYYSEAKEYAKDARVEEVLDGFRRAEAEHQRLVKEELVKLG